jgi:hypothetical protein
VLDVGVWVLGGFNGECGRWTLAAERYVGCGDGVDRLGGGDGAVALAVGRLPLRASISIQRRVFRMGPVTVNGDLPRLVSGIVVVVRGLHSGVRVVRGGAAATIWGVILGGWSLVGGCVVRGGFTGGCRLKSEYSVTWGGWSCWDGVRC